MQANEIKTTRKVDQEFDLILRASKEVSRKFSFYEFQIESLRDAASRLRRDFQTFHRSISAMG